MPRPSSRSVLITGTSTGIGRAASLHLADKGLRVFASVRREKDAAALKSASDRVTPVLLDIADADSRRAAVEQVSAELGAEGLGGLVNNAGYAPPPNPAEFLPLDDLKRVLEVNLLGSFAMTQLALPLLRRARGRVVLVGSVQDRMVPPFFSAYAMSKWALRAMNLALRQELRPWGMESVLVSPGSVRTPIWKEIPNWDGHFAQLGEGAADLYGPFSRAMRDTVTQVAAKGIAPERVAPAIERALTSRRPKPEVLVGPDARFLFRFLGKLPVRVREAVSAAAFKLPRKNSAPLR